MPSDPSSNVPWPWQNWRSDIAVIEAQYNAARSKDPTVAVELKIEYSQEQWNAMTVNQKALYLCNKERMDRGIKPFAGVSREVTDVAQGYSEFQTLAGHGSHDADPRLWISSGRPSDGCCSPWNRLYANPKLKETATFQLNPENLAFSPIDALNMHVAIEFSIYTWIYADEESNWSNRHTNLVALGAGAGVEALGMIGFGCATDAHGTYVVMNVAVESENWDYSDESNLYLWSAMQGGGTGLTLFSPNALPVDPCRWNEHVQNHACVLCPAFTFNVAGDDPRFGDTACDPVVCGENYRVQANGCVRCDAGSINEAGDDPSGPDTFCDEILNEEVSPASSLLAAMNERLAAIAVVALCLAVM